MKGTTLNELLTYFIRRDVPGDSYCMLHAAFPNGFDHVRLRVAEAMRVFTQSEWGPLNIEAFVNQQPLNPYPDENALAAISSVINTSIIVCTLSTRQKIVQASETFVIGNHFPPRRHQNETESVNCRKKYEDLTDRDFT